MFKKLFRILFQSKSEAKLDANLWIQSLLLREKYKKLNY